MNHESKSIGGILLRRAALVAVALVFAPIVAGRAGESRSSRQHSAAGAKDSHREPNWLIPAAGATNIKRPEFVRQKGAAPQDDDDSYAPYWRRHPKTRSTSKPSRPSTFDAQAVRPAKPSAVLRAAHEMLLADTLPEPEAVPVDQPRVDAEEIPPSTQFESDDFGDDLFPTPDDCGECGHCGECSDSLVDGDYGLICPSCYRRWRNFHPLRGGWDCGCPWNWSDELSIFAGTQSFEGPLDLGQNGNFGFHSGLNWAGPLWHRNFIGYQMGVRGVFSDFSGADVAGVRQSSRSQLFVTGGLFFRAPCNHGWQFGVVWDWMQDDYYVDPSLQQMRSQLSYLTFCGHEIGFWTSIASDDNRGDAFGNRFQSLDLYGFFYRYNSPGGSEGRLWGGATDDGDGMLGADFRVPFSLRWSLAGGVNYVIPEQSRHSLGPSEEAWGMSISLVWHPFREKGDCSSNRGQYRPMFDVADNNVFIVGRDLRPTHTIEDNLPIIGHNPR